MKQKLILPSVSAAIFNDKGEVLLQKRRDVGKWCIISGHVEFGETVEAAVLREIFEETNAEAQIVRLIGIYSSPESATYNYDDRIIQYVTSYFEAKLVGTISDGFSNDETGELKFFPVQAIPADLAMLNPNWLSDALNKGSVFFR